MSTQANVGGVKNGLVNNLVERGQCRVVKESVESLHWEVLGGAGGGV